MSDRVDLSDRALWARAAEGDGECFGVLFDRHHGPVRAYCARRAGSVDVADDLVSVVFLEAWRRRESVELINDSALPWLYGIANNTVRRQTRSTIRHRRLLAKLPVDTSTADHADDVAARVDDQRHLAQLHAALGGLRRSDQEVLVLCLWQGLDYASAAIALHVPVGTVRSRLSRARARLRAATRELNPPTPTTATTSPPELP